MKKSLIFLFSAFSLINAVQAQLQTAYQIGYVGGRAQVGNNEVIVSGGMVGASSNQEIDTDQYIMTGFPYPVQYFSQTFDEDLFVSKGYFPNRVEVRWNILASESLITRFLVYRKPVSSDGDSVLVASLSPDEFNYTDEFLDQNVLYKYTIFAKGISDALRLPFVNFIEGSGFAFPVGTVSGRVTFEGGTAVEGVAVVAETDGNVIGQQTIRLDGTNSQLLVPVEAEDTELDLSGGFTLQLWSRYVQNQGSLFKKSDQYELTYDGNNLALTVSGTTLNLPFVAPVDSFFHVSAVYNDQEDYLALYALVNDERLDSARIAFTTPITENLDNIILGEGYDGYLDEVRLWQRALQFDEISANFSRHIAGTEDELSAYWRLDVGAAMEFFDISKQGSTFNENHGRIVDASWSDDSPLQSQLAFRGLTDANGNYTISGFSYETNGSQYRFIPILGQHTFEPNEQTRFVGDGEFIFNGVDFTDVSSFPVSGTVRYRNTKFPVEGVSILIDGKPAIDLEGNLILTDNNGTFTVDVPIGLHGLRVTQQAHGFEGEGRFPPPNGSGVLQLFDFQEALSGLEFIDTTLVKMAGRVVGGPIEAEKLLGFGQSKNNIGSSRIVLKAEKERDLTDSDADSTAVYDENLIETRAEFLFSQPKRATIYTDDQTGEFTAYLPPEKYVVEGILSDGDPNNANFPFADEFHVTIDLRQTVPKNEVFQDTLQAEFLGVLLPNYPPQDPAKFDSVYTVDVADTLFTVGIDTFYFDHRQSFILRNRPTLQVTNLAGEEIFGEQTINVVDENLGIDTDVAVYNNGTYAFGHPIFLQRKTYGLKMSLFEAYFNPDINETDEVPVVDGTIDVQNELAVNTDKVVLTLDERGTTTYTFQGGLPEVNKNPTFPENDFTLPISVTASSGNEGAIKTVWREANPLRGIVFGALPTGNNFVTTGPNEIVTILRDPPGTNSNASIQQGTTTTNTTTSSFTKGFNETFNETLHIGMSLTTFTGAGIGAFQGVINESSSKVDVGLGLDFTQNFQDGNSTVNVTQFNQTISTSTDPGFVSSIGDVFVGFSTNIVYGKTNDLKLLPLVQCDDDCGDVEVSGFRIGIDEGVRMNPEFETGFAFSQAFIESTLIPNLTNLRDNFLIYSQQPDTISAASRVTYVSLVPPDDPRYGTNNTDQTAWGNLAKEENDGNGPSYQVIIPNGIDFTRDSVEFFNEEVNEWISVLAENEKVKVQAQLVKNLSFDGGASISESQTTSNTQEFTYNKTLVFNESVFGETSTEAKIFGVRVGFTHNLGFNFSQVVESGSAVSTENSTTYDFTLEEELGDSYTVDVKAPSDGFGPVFSVRGGATSCPYQDEELTKYYRPGEVLHEATMQREVPSLSVDRAVVADVPENRSAEFLLSLQNNSETAEDFFMTLSAVDATNPFGALLNVDGLLGNGKTFLVQAGETLTKTLKVSKGLSDVLDYEDIELVLRSVCQSDPTDFSPDIADTVAISVFFQPGCSDIAISAPRDNWVINTNTLPSDTMTVNIGNYDLNLNNFRRIAFQYKAVGSSSWITNMVFYNPQQVSQTEFDLLDEPKAFISGPNITYLWDMSGLPDREYDIRAVTFCDIGPGVTHTTPSDILTGTKDTKRPQLFGSPQPADGILSANDEILIQFDETIAAGLLTPFNFSMRGVLNNTARNHNGSVKFDGVNDYVKINDGFNLDKRSWTVEFWLKRGAESREYVVFSKGRLPATDLNFGFTADNRFFIEFGDQRETSSTVFTGQQETVWHHYAVAYDAVNESVNAYRDGEYIFEDIAITANFSGEGPVALGKSETEDNRFLIGNIHDLRIWTKARSLGQVFQDINTRLNGSEVNLVGLWPMDEVRGTQAFDLARSRHATVFAEWQVETQGYALELDGLDDYVEINTASTVVISEEMNFAVEFWFKAETGQSDVVMFSSGRADGTDVLTPPDLAWNIGFDDQQRLFVLNNGNKVTVTESTSPLQDDNWHHFAMSLDRRANLNVFIDGELKATTSSEDFGGLAGSRMWMGARAFKSGASTTIFDQYFDGHIDEFRIWTLDRSREQLLLDMNHRLLGDERGLVAYYPFEAFEISVGVNVLVPSFDEQLSNPPGGGGEGLLSGGPNLTAVTPNIKLARPVEDVNFSWVVNDDAIIIIPDERLAAQIERTVLTITVEGVEDLFENRMASPVSWTAFIDQNQVKWSEDFLALEKPVGEELSFTIDIVNLGGTEENFRIENLPLWLTASPQSGTLAPTGSQTITLTVNPGLNTGFYEEDILLRSDFGFDEKLGIDLNVISPRPAWDVNPEDYQFSMSFVGIVEIGGVVSTDRDDIVAAFVGDEVRGVANLQLIPELDLYQVFLTVYSNEATGEQVAFQIWDASIGVIHGEAEIVLSTGSPPQLSIDFLQNQSFGTPSSPILFRATDKIIQRIPLKAGWNWISFNVDSERYSDLNALLGGLNAENGDRMKSLLGPGSDGLAVYDDLTGWEGNLPIDVTRLYKLRLSNADTLAVLGTPVSVAQVPVAINTGWNWISYLPQFNMEIGEALASLESTEGDLIKNQSAFAVYDDDLGWLGSLTFLRPGEGYMLNASNTGSLTYPQNSILNSSRVANRGRGAELLATEESNMTVIAMLEGSESQQNHLIGAYVEGDLVGVSSRVPRNDGRMYHFLTVGTGGRSGSIRFALLDQDLKRIASLDNTMPATRDLLVGSLQEPYIFRLGAYDPLVMYPNPVHDHLELAFYLHQGGQVNVDILDLSGKVISTRTLEYVPSGNTVIKIDGVDALLETGNYLLRLRQNGETSVTKMIKL